MFVVSVSFVIGSVLSVVNFYLNFADFINIVTLVNLLSAFKLVGTGVCSKTPWCTGKGHLSNGVMSLRSGGHVHCDV